MCLSRHIRLMPCITGHVTLIIQDFKESPLAFMIMERRDAPLTNKLVPSGYVLKFWKSVGKFLNV